MQTEYQAAGQIINLPVGVIVRSTTNPRINFDEKALEELAASITQVGVLEPVIVRPHPQDQEKYVLVAGERRWLASQLANKEMVPSIIREFTDQQAEEAQIVENLQRADLHPLEEAKSYARLMESNPDLYTVEELAHRLGKHEQFIANRVQLLSLNEDAQQLLLANRLPITHAFEISRLQPPNQEEALHRCFRDFKSAAGVLKDSYRTVEVGLRELREWIKSHCVLDLKAAPFDTRDAELVPEAGACSVCPKRAGSNPTLFGDIAKGNRCLDGNCFESKRQKLVQIRMDELHGEGMTAVRVSGEFRNGIKEEAKNVLYRGEYVLAKSGSCEFAQPGIYVDGADFAKQVQICAHKEKCPVHHASSSHATPAQREQRKEELRRQKAEKTFRWNLIAAVKNKLPKVHKHEDLLLVALHLNRRMGHDNRQRVFKVYGWEQKKTPSKYGGSHVDWEGLAARQIEKMNAAELIQFLIVSTLANDLLIASYNQEQTLPTTSGLAQTAKRYGVDLKEFRRKASAESGGSAKHVN